MTGDACQADSPVELRGRPLKKVPERLPHRYATRSPAPSGSSAPTRGPAATSSAETSCPPLTSTPVALGAGPPSPPLRTRRGARGRHTGCESPRDEGDHHLPSIPLTARRTGGVGSKADRKGPSPLPDAGRRSAPRRRRSRAPLRSEPTATWRATKARGRGRLAGRGSRFVRRGWRWGRRNIEWPSRSVRRRDGRPDWLLRSCVLRWRRTADSGASRAIVTARADGVE